MSQQALKFEEVLENSKCMVASYRTPSVVMVKGEGSYLWDMDNQKYIDFFAGIAVNSLGHCDPEVTQIIHEQSSLLLHSSFACPTEWPYALAAKLVEKTKESGGMYNASSVFFSNSGAEANEAALKFARRWGKSIAEDKHEIICFSTSFHGRTFGALSVTSKLKYQEPFTPLVPGVKQAQVGDIESVKKLISEKTCAVIIEPVQGEGGVRPVDEDFLIELKKLCTKYQAALIYDEVQVGVGRSGTLWAHSKLPKEGHPDIFTSAKALANGCPIGATIISPEINEVLQPADHGSTFGGNPISTRVACNVLDRISNKQFLEDVQRKAKLLQSGLSQLQTKYPGIVEDVRGSGLMMGMELTVEAKPVVAKAREFGLVTTVVGDNIVRLLPALNIPDDVLLEGVSILERTLDALFGTK
ncbi:hypothetical protein OGAPHI_005403 [Ogataea philodendri]|uniref:Acetylornithine aminotransferase, mitochondrial n=1 Tax=Ogataea philodendri TaxID=1378263 RepID=A0A9P8NZ41_9ASCO|nr:uncharacterized protein OGAPHI_005403 [Ogataea philodendri]KAH3662155.1 hypothetical protein OGAPHI_005403 [Ogataea philodendri]